MKRNFLALAAMALLTLNVSADDGNTRARQLAFPTAEGYGKYTVGGRGGKVIHVTNLNDSGAGSFRAAVSESGPRTVVFDVSGTIHLSSNVTIRNPYLTIAGQTAPGDGICLRGGALGIGADQVIIRHIRVRVGDELEGDYDAVECRGRKHVILDHVSASWSVDETMSVYGCDSITVQWCIVSESMYYSHHVKGSHGFGGIWGANFSTYHHNLLAHHSSRNPRIASNCGYMDYRNNVIYNWGYNSCYGGEFHDPYTPKETDHSYINLVNNYYKPGPATQPGDVTKRIANPSCRDNSYDDYGKWYIAGNYMFGNGAVSANNWNGGVQVSGGISQLKMEQPWEAMPITQQTAQEAYALVLDQAGATRPRRDAIDTRICAETRDGYATYEGKEYKPTHKVADATKPCGIIDSQTDAGGWPELKSEPAPTDTDRDGMPDAWETQHGLNPNDHNDRNTRHSSGYTALEVYLNELCGETIEGEFEKKPTADGEVVSVYWRLEEDDQPTVTGQIEALAETFSGLKLDRYTAPNSSNTIWPSHTGYDTTRKTQRVGIIDGAWPGEEAYVPGRYVQFGIRAAQDSPLLLDSISLFVCGCGTNGMQCQINYDTDETFGHAVMIGDYNAKGAMANSNIQEVTAAPALKLEPGQSVFLWVFPWSRGAMSGKTICLSDVRFRATLTTTGITQVHADYAQPTAVYALDGSRMQSPHKGLSIVRTANNQYEKRVIF